MGWQPLIACVMGLADGGGWLTVGGQMEWRSLIARVMGRTDGGRLADGMTGQADGDGLDETDR